MGTAKQAAIKERRENPYERAIRRYNELREHFAGKTSNLCHFMENDDEPALGLSFRRRDDGGFLAVATRDNELKEEVMFAYGEDMMDCFLKLDSKLNKGKWQKNKTLAERQAEAKGKRES